jgi:hypothetical protein
VDQGSRYRREPCAFEVRCGENGGALTGSRRQANDVILTRRDCNDWRPWIALTEGANVLPTSVNDSTDGELWQSSAQLSRAQAAFRIHKSDLSIRPIWHQKAERVQVHIRVCFLAFCMWKALEGWQNCAGLGSSPRKLLDEPQRIQTVGVVIPIVNGSKPRMRCVMQLERDLACLPERVGLRLPTRLRVPEGVSADIVGMSARESARATPPRPLPIHQAFQVSPRTLSHLKRAQWVGSAPKKQPSDSPASTAILFPTRRGLDGNWPRGCSGRID